MNKKSIIGLIVVLCVLTAFVPCTYAAQIVDSGTCGDNITWSLSDDGTLTISGEGNMDNWYIGNYAPWNKVDIKTVNIENGVKNIGSYAFAACSNLISIYIPDSVVFIGQDAFHGCKNLANLRIGNKVTHIGAFSFDGCYSLTSIDIPDSVIVIDWGAFCACTSLTSIKIPKSVTTIGWAAFEYCSELKDIYYLGSEEQWKDIAIDNHRNDTLFNATIYYNAIGINPPQIKGISKVDGNNLDISLEYVEYDSDLITVFSNDKTMISVIKTHLVASDTSKLITIPSNSTKAKVFIWNSFDGMKPLCESKFFTMEIR